MSDLYPAFIDTRCERCLPNQKKLGAAIPREVFKATRASVYRCMGCGIMVSVKAINQSLQRRDWEKNTGRSYREYADIPDSA